MIKTPGSQPKLVYKKMLVSNTSRSQDFCGEYPKEEYELPVYFLAPESFFFVKPVLRLKMFISKSKLIGMLSQDSVF
jgi:hypothetical protein